MRLLDETSPEGEIHDLWSVLWDALVLPSHEPETLQGKLLLAWSWVSGEFYRNGMMNYYTECLEPRPDGHVQKVDVLVDTLVPELKAKILEDRKHVAEAQALQAKEEESGLSEAEAAHLETLLIMSEGDWEELIDRTERLALNYCIANPLPSFESLLQRDDAPPSTPSNASGWLGLQVTWSKDGLRVDGVDPRSPAFGKLRVGDMIDLIDGTKTATLDGPEWAMKLLSGNHGSTVFFRVGKKLVKVVRAPRQG